MPLIYRVLGFGGNGLFLLIGLLALISGEAYVAGIFMVALAGLNLFLIRKIDLYSREEEWLEAEVHKRELRRQIAEMDAAEAAEKAGEASAQGLPPGGRVS